MYNINMYFEWDENKNEENIRKHDGISFEKALKAFDDPVALSLEDSEHSNNEEIRYAVVGMSEFGLIFVSFTYQDESIRLISARKASKTMEKKYDEQKF